VAKYKKCPRCELNYIKVEEDYCAVCKTEMKLAPEDSLSDDMELCPVCGQNFVSVDQVMCDECAKKRTLDDVVDESDDDLQSRSSKDDWDEETKALDSIEEESKNAPVDDDIEVVNFSDLDEDDDEDDDWGDDDGDSSVDHFEDDDDFDYSDLDDDDFEDSDDDDVDDDDDDYEDDFLGKKK